MLEDMLRSCVIDYEGSWDRHIVAPLFGPTRLAGPNQIRDALIPLKCSNPQAWPDLVGRSEPKPKDSRPKPLIKSIYQIHFINISVLILKSLRERFQFGASP